MDFCVNAQPVSAWQALEGRGTFVIVSSLPPPFGQGGRSFRPIRLD